MTLSWCILEVDRNKEVPATLPTPFCDLWKDIFSEEKQNKNIYLLKLQILKHPASCAKECLVGKKRKDESKYYAAPVMNYKVVSKWEQIINHCKNKMFHLKKYFFLLLLYKCWKSDFVLDISLISRRYSNPII